MSTGSCRRQMLDNSLQTCAAVTDRSGFQKGCFESVCEMQSHVTWTTPQIRVDLRRNETPLVLCVASDIITRSAHIIDVLQSLNSGRSDDLADDQ